MPHETPNERPVLSQMEWEEFCNDIQDMDDPKLTDWMAEKNISFDQGLIEVELDGEIVQMVTSKEDFGTILQSDKK